MSAHRIGSGINVHANRIGKGIDVVAKRIGSGLFVTARIVCSVSDDDTLIFMAKDGEFILSDELNLIVGKYELQK